MKISYFGGKYDGDSDSGSEGGDHPVDNSFDTVGTAASTEDDDYRCRKEFVDVHGADFEVNRLELKKNDVLFDSNWKLLDSFLFQCAC